MQFIITRNTCLLVNINSTLDVSLSLKNQWLETLHRGCPLLFIYPLICAFVIALVINTALSFELIFQQL